MTELQRERLGALLCLYYEFEPSTLKHICRDEMRCTHNQSHTTKQPQTNIEDAIFHIIWNNIRKTFHKLKLLIFGLYKVQSNGRL